MPALVGVLLDANVHDEVIRQLAPAQLAVTSGLALCTPGEDVSVTLPTTLADCALVIGPRSEHPANRSDGFGCHDLMTDSPGAAAQLCPSALTAASR